MEASGDGKIGGAAAFLQLSGLGKRFRDFDAVKAVDLDVAEGEFLTLLGPSGCGKSTLLRMVGGFELPSRGRVLLRRRDLTTAVPEARPFNMVFQSYALFPHMTVAENVGYGPRIAGQGNDDIRRRVEEALELVHLRDFARRSVSELSGGQQQRVALARALVNEPEVLLLDEPLGALDLQLRRWLQEELRSIQRRLGTTFIYVTHDQEEALTLSHRIAVMERGELVQVSDIREIYERPATKFVAEFVGSTNLIDCTVVEERSGRAEVRFANGFACELAHHGSRPFDREEQALAVLRPHQLEVGTPESSSFRGTVSESLYLGTHTRHDVVLDDGTSIHVDADPGSSLTAGERVGVQVKGGSGAVVRDEVSELDERAED